MTKTDLIDERAFQEALKIPLNMNPEVDDMDLQLRIFVMYYEEAKRKRKRISRKLWDELENIPNVGDGY